MAKLTKTQKKRMLDAILSKTMTLYGLPDHTGRDNELVSMKDFDMIRRMVNKAKKRLG